MVSFIRREARWLGAGFLLTFFSGFGQTYFISLSNDALMARFSLGHGGIGLVYAAATLTSAAILLELGKIVDRVSTRSSVMIIVAGLCISCLLVSLAGEIWVLFFALVGLRLFGQGMMSHVAMTATGRWFEANRGRAVSLVALGHPASEAVLPPVAIAVLLGFGLHEMWLIGSAVLALVALPVLFFLLYRERVPNAPAGRAGDTADRMKINWRRRDVLREPVFFVLLLGVLCPPFMVTGLFFHQQHLIAIKDWPAGLWAAGFTVFAAAQVASSLVSGALTDRFSARALLPFYLLPLAVALVLPALLNPSVTIFALMVLLGLTGGAATTIMGAIWPEVFGVKYLGEIRALTFAAMVAATATSPVITGTLVDAGVPFPAQLVVMGGYCLLASGVMGLIQPRLAALACDETRPRSAPQG